MPNRSAATERRPDEDLRELLSLRSAALAEAARQLELARGEVRRLEVERDEWRHTATLGHHQVVMEWIRSPEGQRRLREVAPVPHPPEGGRE